MDALTDAPAALGPARALIVPMRNEVARIERSLAAIAGSPLAVGDVELILVDDGSDDATAAVARAAATRLGLRFRVVELGRNQGKGAAVRTGMLVTDAAARVFVDADLSVEIKDILRCFEVLEGGGPRSPTAPGPTPRAGSPAPSRCTACWAAGPTTCCSAAWASPTSGTPSAG